MTSPILTLPREIIWHIMRSCHSLETAFNMVKTCKQMRYEFMSGGGLLVYAILSRNLGPSRVAIATARHAAVHAAWKHRPDPDLRPQHNAGEYLHHTMAFCSKYLSRQGTELRVPKVSFTLAMGLYIEHIDAIIINMSKNLAWKVLNPVFQEGPVYIMNPSPIELEKMSKAIYILDMALHLFSYKRNNPYHPDASFNIFWSCFAP
ncbi:hypothetical protein ANO14919_088610 [Xylariales sp. No.14919]|nr:hypothetical protein ANO14919_088610 [Xylariales sp. No.14919]